MPDARALARRALPPAALRWARTRAARFRADPPVGGVDLGDLARTTPVGAAFGTSRGGEPVDRRYIDRFLRASRSDIRGRVLEIAEDRYATSIGGAAVESVDVLSLEPSPATTIVADLCAPGELAWGRYDCVILTQTLQFVRDPATALATVQRLLAPGGVLLATVPGISQLSRYDADRWGDRWRFTSLSLTELLHEQFEDCTVTAHGNVLIAVALLEGLVVEDVPAAAWAEDDPDYEVVISARAVQR